MALITKDCMDPQIGKDEQSKKAGKEMIGGVQEKSEGAIEVSAGAEAALALRVKWPFFMHHLR